MAITAGDSTDGVRTGLAGRIANAIVTAFVGTYAVTYPAGANHKKGLNAFIQGLVDALNNDKVDSGTQLSMVKVAARATTAQAFVNSTSAVVNFDTVDIDTDAAVTTGASWHFTVPTGKGGVYFIEAQAVVLGVDVNAQCDLDLFVNGSEARRLKFEFNRATIADYVRPSGFVMQRLSVGDSVDVRMTLFGIAANRSLIVDNLAKDTRISISGPWGP